MGLVKMLRGLVLILIGLGWLINSTANAEDVVRINIRQSDLDQRTGYKEVLLRAILDKTLVDYGPYRIDTSIERTTRNRALREMVAGGVFNAYIAPADPDWEVNTIPIRIPIRRGLLNYRLLLTTKSHVQALGKIQTADDLKAFRLGLRAQWTTTKVMRALDFDVIRANGYDNLFEMLAHDRFDYIPRGINEVFGELRVRQRSMPNLEVESKVALYLPMPVYFYVSPKSPRLAKRLETGFKRLIADGGFDALFKDYFGEQVEAAKLHERRIIHLGNPLLSSETPFNEPELWFYPIEAAGGR